MKHIVLGMVAHVDAGKTTLSENFLFLGGEIRKIGRVDNKDTYLDNNVMERERGITIFSKQAEFNTGAMEVTLLDTPGHVDFSAEMERTLQVLDYAVLIVSASDGIKGHTKTLWKLLDRYKIPVFIFVNKMDRPGSDKENILRLLKDSLSDRIADFSDTESSSFYEETAVCDESVLEKYLEGGNISDEMITGMISERKLFPCYFGSALKSFGIEEFLRGLEKYTAEPVREPEFGAVIYKISRDAQGNRLTHLKVTGGSLKVRTILEDFGKINQIRIYSGEKFTTCDEVFAGHICAVTGLVKTRPGMTLGKNNTEILPVLAPVLTYRIILPKGIDEAGMLPKLKEIEEEEPNLHILWNEELREIHAQIMGEVQTEILKRLIHDRFGVDILFGPGKIVYKETIADTVEGVGHFEPLRHYAEVHLIIGPGERGSGMQFLTSCSEDMLSKNWQRLILTHLEEKVHEGVLTGSEITDIRITVAAGKAHDKHTEGGDFRQATYRAVRNGLMKARSLLLEPYYDFILDIPDNCVGRAMTDMEKMHAKPESPILENGRAYLKGYGPVALLRDYQKEVTIYTKGAGHISYTLRGYDICHNPEEVIESIGYDPERDIRNSPDSVFCAHGAGFVVPWNQVTQYMHVESVLEPSISDDTPINIKYPVSETESGHFDSLGTEEIDEIIRKAGGANGVSKEKGFKKHRADSFAVTRDYNKSSAHTQKPKYLLVDGYNIIFAWKELKELAASNIGGARGRLLDILCNYRAIKNVNLIAVFDAYRVKNHPTEIFDYHNIHVVFTEEARTADSYIEQFAHDNKGRYNITVATSDGLEQIIIRGQGCYLISAREFEKEVHDTIASEIAAYEAAKTHESRFFFDEADDELQKQIAQGFTDNDDKKETE